MISVSLPAIIEQFVPSGEAGLRNTTFFWSIWVDAR